MPPSKKPAAKKQPLTLAQLAAYDDILTDALVDHVSTFAGITRGAATHITAAKLTELYLGVLLDNNSQEPLILPPFTRNTRRRYRQDLAERSCWQQRPSGGREKPVGNGWITEVP